MRSRLAQLVLLVTIALTGDGLRPVSMHAAGAVGTAKPIQAVRVLVRPLATHHNGSWPCNTLTGKLAACPMTARLRYRLQHVRVNANLICRCQNPPRSVRIYQIRNNGRRVLVNVWWDYGPNAFTSTFVVVWRGGLWLVDDMYCAGRPGTSFYRLIGPCR